MKMEEWTPETTRLTEDAARYTGYYKSLALIATRGLQQGAHVVDAGCGTGLLSLEMAALGMQVTAIDRNPCAVAYTAKRAADMGICVIEGDYGDVGLIPRDCDRIVFSLSAGVTEAIHIGVEAGARSTVVINKIRKTIDGDTCKHVVRSMGDALSEMNSFDFACISRRISLEYGQPFHNRAEARRYFEMYPSKRKTQGSIDEEIETSLERAHGRGYAYYLPIERQLSVLEIPLVGNVFESGRRHSPRTYSANDFEMVV